MKKVLLTLAAAMMVAMSASAQFINVQKTQKMDTPECLKKENVMKIDVPTPVLKAKTLKRASSVIGQSYILNAQNYDGDFTSSTVFTIEEASGTIMPYVPEGEEAEEFEYNVVLNDFPMAGAKTYGFYDATTASIVLPTQNLGNSQTVFGASTDYGDVIFSALASDGNQMANGLDMVIFFNEDGTIEIYDMAEELAEAEFPENFEVIGFYNSLTNEEGAWNYGFYCEIMVPNATLKFTTTSKALGGTGSGWTNGLTRRIYVEDWGSEYTVSNFLGTVVSITNNGDGTCLMPFPQDYDDYDYEKYDSSYPFGRLQFRGVTENEEGYLDIDYESEGLKGYIYDEGIEFFQTEYRDAFTDAQGTQHEAGYYIISSLDNYYCIATNAPSSDQAYFGGYITNTSIMFDEVNVEGITTVNANSKSTKTFNLMGQQVSRANAKGIVIRDGKKLMMK